MEALAAVGVLGIFPPTRLYVSHSHAFEYELLLQQMLPLVYLMSLNIDRRYRHGCICCHGHVEHEGKEV
jgi:hypothetical protein